ncbi:MAG TPA: KR domain-containing protein, partial [Thermoanaerobaculia bacterium]|nr:KR domain-containing protein [Thermoanaerobaculia bacterium]
LGPCRVIPKEYPNLACRTIDVAPPAPGSWQEDWLAERLVAELENRPAGEADFAVAYRDQARWAMTFEPLRLETPQGVPPRLRQGGVYMITGGLAGIGLEVARHLAGRVQAKLVLTGRAPLPEEGVPGAEVLAAPGVDVSDLAAMTALVEQARERFGAIHGVIHAEEPGGSGLIQFKDRQAAAAVLAVKVEGTRILDRLLGGPDLDFFVLFSSAFALTGGLGLVDQCAGNAFLGAFAQCESSRRPGFVLSLDWSVWQTEEAGPAETPGTTQAVQSHLDKVKEESGITFAEGLDLFDRALAASTVPQLVVSRQDVRAMVSQQSALTAWSLLGEMERGDAAYDRPDLTTTYAPPANDIESAIVESMQRLFGIDQIGIHDDFFELGGHSLMAVQLVSRLRALFQVDLSLSSVFETPTVRGLAARIAEMRLDSLEDASELEELLRDIESLSEEELRREIARELAAGEGEARHG